MLSTDERIRLDYYLARAGGRDHYKALGHAGYRAAQQAVLRFGDAVPRDHVEPLVIPGHPRLTRAVARYIAGDAPVRDVAREWRNDDLDEVEQTLDAAIGWAYTE